MPIVEFLILVLSVLFSVLAYGGGFPITLVLERVDSVAKFSELKTRDWIRHGHMFQSSSMHGVVDFPLRGSSDPSTYGLYFTRVKFGNPPREYHLLIDTGSDITWVNCNPCIGCPRTSTLIHLSFFDPRSSYSSAPISCSGHICKSTAEAHHCSSNSMCSYSILYQDTSTVSGYYVSDSFHFDTITGNSVMATYEATMIFGCTNNQSGSLTEPQSAVDGIFGLGPHPMSFISQLASRGLAPNVFSHCLNGEDKGGGGILVLGEIVEPDIVYSPLVPKQPHYNLNLLSISLGRQLVPIDPKVFSASKNRRGTIVDSGTTYTYLTEEAYDPFVTALLAAVSPSVSSFPYDEGQCFQVSNSIGDVFPLVSLNFEGGASMVLKPDEYLLQWSVNAAPRVWCVGFQKSQGVTILGELVLKNKIIVYDLARQRLGWADYDCSSSVNVSLVPPKVSCSSRDVVVHQFLRGMEDHQVLVLQKGSLPLSSDEQGDIAASVSCNLIRR